MIARASGLLALAAVGVALTGCQTTQQKSAELERQAQREQAQEAAEQVRTDRDGDDASSRTTTDDRER